MSRYALCSDPATAPATLAFLAAEALSRTERDALYRNPALPFDDLFLALCGGKTAALHNPALPLYLLDNPGTGDDSADKFNDEITLAGAILRCLTDGLSALCKAAPRDGGVDVLRTWLFAALWVASSRSSPPEVARFLSYADDEWHEVAVGLCDGMPAGDRLGGSAQVLVYHLVTQFLAVRDVPFILALADNLAALGVSHDSERHLVDVRAAAGLLGCEAPRPVAHPNQLDLFSTEAA